MKVFTEKFKVTKTEDDTYLLSIKVSDSQVTVLSVAKRDIEQLQKEIEQLMKVDFV
jgi:hypothetical protein